MVKTLSAYLTECYVAIKKHCYYNDGTPVFSQQKLDKAIIACEFDLLVLLKGDFSPLEKIAMLTAKEYWLNESVELTPVVQLLAQKLSEGLAYKSPKVRAKRECLLSLLDTGENNVFLKLEPFFDHFAKIQLPMLMVKSVLDNHFDGLLKKLANNSDNAFSFKMG